MKTCPKVAGRILGSSGKLAMAIETAVRGLMPILQPLAQWPYTVLERKSRKNVSINIRHHFERNDGTGFIVSCWCGEPRRPLLQNETTAEPKINTCTNERAILWQINLKKWMLYLHNGSSAAFAAWTSKHFNCLPLDALLSPLTVGFSLGRIAALSNPDKIGHLTSSTDHKIQHFQSKHLNFKNTVRQKCVKMCSKFRARNKKIRVERRTV